MPCCRKKNAARQAKNAGQKNGCLRKFRKVPERLLQAPGVRESECAEPRRAVVVMPPKEKCGVSGKECGAKKRLLEKMPQGAGAFRRGCRGCGKANAPNQGGRSLSCRRRKNAACQAKNAGQKNGCLRKCRKVPERFVAGVGGAGKRMRRTKEGGRCHAAEGKMRRVRQRMRGKKTVA